MKTSAFKEIWEPGHYYSVLPSLAESAQDAERIYNYATMDFPGVDLRLEAQIDLVRDLRDNFADKIPYDPEFSNPNLRFTHKENRMYGYKDAAILFTMLLKYKPRRVIEIGSGFSSMVMLDANDVYFDKSMNLTFIEPYPQRLKGLMRDSVDYKVQVHEKRVQDIDLKVFDDLAAGDILFIDSSHVMKIGSDVNFELFEILPRLAKGVLVHFHDIHYPFEYPRQWTEEGRAWNEAYALRAFMQFNAAFKIVLFTSLIHHHYMHELGDHWLFSAKDGSRTSFWMEKTV